MPLFIRQFDKLDGERVVGAVVVVVVVIGHRHATVDNRATRPDLRSHERLDEIAVELGWRQCHGGTGGTGGTAFSAGVVER